MADSPNSTHEARNDVGPSMEHDLSKAMQLCDTTEDLMNDYHETGCTEDLEGALRAAQELVADLPAHHPERPKWLHNLGTILWERYERFGSLDNLEESICEAREAVKLTPKEHPNHIAWLDGLGVGLRSRYTELGAMEDLDEGIDVAKVVVARTQSNDPARAIRLNNLGHLLHSRSERTGALDDLKESTRLAQEAVEITLEGDPYYAVWMHSFGDKLASLYSRTGKMHYLEDAICKIRTALEKTPANHPDRASIWNSLGVRYGEKYNGSGAMEDLNEAIRFAQKAIKHTEEDDRQLAERLHNLGTGLGERYSRTNAIADLKEAIKIAQKAEKITPREHPALSHRLYNLALDLNDLYNRTGEIDHLSMSIDKLHEAVKIRPTNHPKFAELLSSLGTSLGDRYANAGMVDDLEESIRRTQQAVDMTPPDQPDLASYLNHLGLAHKQNYSRTNAINDLDRAITASEKAVHMDFKDNPDHAIWSYNLGEHLGRRYLANSDTVDLRKALSCLRTALHQSNATCECRILAGHSSLRLRMLIPGWNSDWEQAYDDASLAIKLIRELTPRSLENSDKQHVLGQIANLACNATAIALHLGKPPLVALDLLEQGRGVLATSLDENWADISDLKSKFPDLAGELIELRDALQAPLKEHLGSRRTSFRSTRANRRHIAGGELEKLIAKIRQREGFELFLQNPSEKEMLDASKRGPVVVLNISKFRCDAMLIRPHGVQCIPLTRLDYPTIERTAQHQDLGSPQVLEWLWDTITLPVLIALEITEPPCNDDWPHVWWVPTGILSKFPLHAAGFHGKDPNFSVLDRAMSSYSPSIKTIIHGRQRHNRQDEPKGSTKVLLVALQDTPKQGRLHFAASEVKLVHDICVSSSLCPVQPKQIKEDIVSQLPSCKFFHFAGHGHTDDSDPSESSLLLEDWESDPLAVANLLQMNLREHPPFLAYLSACGTGQVRLDRYLDESIHLISACQLAGFRHVIGTLWEVNDESCVEMARITYEEIMRKGITDDSVCLGLHKATRALRDRWLRNSKEGSHRKKVAAKNRPNMVQDVVGAVGDGRKTGPARTIVLCDSDDEEIGPLHWVPYVHFGI